MSEHLDEDSLVDLGYFFLIEELVQLSDALFIEIISTGYIANGKNHVWNFERNTQVRTNPLHILVRFEWDLASNSLTIEQHGELKPFHASHTVSVIKAEVLFAQLDFKLAELSPCLVLVHLIIHGIILAWLSLTISRVRISDKESLLFPCSFHLCRFISFN